MADSACRGRPKCGGQCLPRTTRMLRGESPWPQTFLVDKFNSAASRRRSWRRVRSSKCSLRFCSDLRWGARDRLLIPTACSRILSSLTSTTLSEQRLFRPAENGGRSILFNEYFEDISLVQTSTAAVQIHVKTSMIHSVTRHQI